MAIQNEGIKGFYIFLNILNIEVRCGYFGVLKARTCSDCPQGKEGHGKRWCNGDCTWVDNKCIRKGKGKFHRKGGAEAEPSSAQAGLNINFL